MVRILFLLLVWSDMMENVFVRRDFLKNKVLKAENDVRSVCYYCKSCESVKKFYAIRNELKMKGLNSFNKNVPFWNVFKDRFCIEHLPLDLQM